VECSFPNIDEPLLLIMIGRFFFALLFFGQD